MKPAQHKKRAASLALALAALLLTACQNAPRPVCEYQGNQYCKTEGIFGGEWFDYFERGLSCMEGECYDAALTDFTQAIQRRDRDERMAQTYGFHFADYFPHREKGIVHFIQGDYEQAQQELESSLKHVRTDKALIWLDEVRKERLRRAKQPPTQPQLNVTFPDSQTGPDGKIWSRRDPFHIRIQAEDSRYVASVTIEDFFSGQTESRNLFLESSEQNVDLSENFMLQQGEHLIRITAKNLQGGRTGRDFRIHADREGPVLMLETFRPGVFIKGALYDASEQISLTLNGVPLKLRKKNGRWIFETELTPDTLYPELIARDRLGNQTIAATGPSLTAHLPYPLLAGNHDTLSDMNPFHDYSRSPVIHLKNLSDQETVFRGSIHIEGHVRSASPLTELKVNGEPVLKNVPRSTGTVIFFNHPLKLGEGANRILITAGNRNGQKITKPLTVYRKIPEAFHWKNRYRMALYPFEGIEKSEMAKRFQYLFVQHLAVQKRFCLLMRDDMKRLLGAYPKVPDRFSPKPSHAVLSGFVYQSKKGTEIVAELTDKATSESIGFIDVYARKGIGDTSERMAGRLSEKMHRKFPLADGTVLSIEKGVIRSDTEKWTPGKGPMYRRWPILLYRLKKPLSKHRGNETDVLGTSRIRGLIPGGFEIPEIPEIRNGDRIITQ